MTALLWFSLLGLIAGGIGLYLTLKHERMDRCLPPVRTRYPRKP